MTLGPEEQPVLPDKTILVCNFGIATRACAKGSLCYVIRQYPDTLRVKVLARSRSGHWIEKWDAQERFYNFRFKVIPPQHPMYDEPRLYYKASFIQDKSPNWIEEAPPLSNAEAQARRREGQENDIWRSG